MSQTSRHWLAGLVLVLAMLGGSLTLSLHAQSPAPNPSPPGTVPRSGAAGPDSADPKGSVEVPGLPAGRSGSAVSQQGDLLRYSRNVPGDAKPIVLEASEVFTWNENGQVAFLLVGQVLVQQSVVQVRCEQAVAWVDVPRYQRTGILHLDLYAEGPGNKVRLDCSGEIQDGNRAALDLNTRGEFRVRGSRGKVQRQEHGHEAIVGRARALELGPRPAQDAPRPPSPASALPPVPGVAPGPVQPARSLPAPPTAGGVRQTSFNQEGPGSESQASSALVSAQAVEPAPAPAAPPRTDPLPVPPPSPSLGGYGPTDTLPPPQQDLPPPAPKLPLPAPPSQDAPARRDSRRQPDPEPPAIPAAPPVELPPPSQVPPPSTQPVPLPPPSRATEPPRPGELPKASSPQKPLEHRLLQRSGEKFDLEIKDLPGGRRIITATGGVILNVRNVPKVGILDVEADRAVIWVKDRDKAEQTANNLRSDQGETSTELEFYMAGHVTLRSSNSPKDKTVLEADELYYDANRNVAVALQGRLEMHSKRMAGNTEPLILTAPELLRTGPNTYEVVDAHIFSSKLPSDPGLELLVAKATVTNREHQRTFFGQPVFDKKGNPVMIEESIVKSKHVLLELEGVPVFYTPYLVTDARDPLGPLETINIGGNNVYGVEGGVGLNLYKLFGVQPIEGTRSRLLLDYMSRRGPAAGLNFDYNGIFDSLYDPSDPYGLKPRYEGQVRTYGLNDDGTDILGFRPPQYLTFHPPGMRGRAAWRQGVFDLPNGFDVIAQMSLLSDRNFLEQYFKREFDSDPNQANFLYVKQQQDNWAWTLLGQGRTSNWITTTQWLPRADGYLLGQDFFDLITTNTQVSLAYADLRLSSDQPLRLVGAPNPPGYPAAFHPTDRNNATGRFAVLEEIDLPLNLGALNLIPYAKGALVEYTNTLDGNEVGRVWGGLGARASLPLTRLYPEAQSELFNVNGINHKLVFGANYFYARANEPYTRFAQLDRLNDDATAQMLREMSPYQPMFNKQAGFALATSPYFDTQRYAIRRLVDNRIDTLDGIQVLQLDLRQRLQTKRGFPGYEHIIDWMRLDTSVSLFPQPNRDNFGETFSFLEYQYVWNIGDRTALDSSGWFDPQENGVRVYTVGMMFNRPDRTVFSLNYRQTDPLQSRIVLGSVSYTFSPKYAMTLATAYDFGTQAAQTNTVILTRTGTDLQVSLGFSYNSLQKNFGAIVEIVPSMVPLRRGAPNFGMLATAQPPSR